MTIILEISNFPVCGDSYTLVSLEGLSIMIQSLMLKTEL